MEEIVAIDDRVREPERDRDRNDRERNRRGGEQATWLRSKAGGSPNTAKTSATSVMRPPTASPKVKLRPNENVAASATAATPRLSRDERQSSSDGLRPAERAEDESAGEDEDDNRSGQHADAGAHAGFGQEVGEREQRERGQGEAEHAGLHA